MKKAQFWHNEEDKTVRCELCPHHCLIKEGNHGLCRIRVNKDGTLSSTGYGEIVSCAIDPIEKKPLYHFYPGKNILSVGVNGCNLQCSFCQNWQVSQVDQPTEYVSPEELVELALQRHSFGIAFTYTEPLIWYEYILDCAPIAHEKGLKIVLVSNGYISPEPAKELIPHIDAANIDLKSMDDSFYRSICKGSLNPVLEFIKAAAPAVHVEITNLIIPTLNDSDDNIERLARFVASVNRDIPVHFSAYFPQYKMELPSTDSEILLKAYEIAKKYLNYVYLGNVRIDTGSDTTCPKCSNLLIKRSGYSTKVVGLNHNQCSKCNTEIAIRM